MEGEIGRWEGAGCEREEEGEEVTEVHIVGDVLVLRYEIYAEEEIVIISFEGEQESESSAQGRAGIMGQ